MNEQDIHYALAKQVPDMARGFTIQTNYGDIVFAPGFAAERVQRQVKRILTELDLAQRKQHAANQKASAVVSAVFGGGRS